MRNPESRNVVHVMIDVDQGTEWQAVGIGLISFNVLDIGFFGAPVSFLITGVLLLSVAIIVPGLRLR